MFDRCDWIPQSAVTLYIYRVGGLAQQEILLQDLNLLKSLVVLGFHLDRSDRSALPEKLQHLRPVRPPGMTGQIGRSRLLPILVINTIPWIFMSDWWACYVWNLLSIGTCLFRFYVWDAERMLRQIIEDVMSSTCLIKRAQGVHLQTWQGFSSNGSYFSDRQFRWLI